MNLSGRSTFSNLFGSGLSGLGILREKGSSVAEYVAGLDDADLDSISNLSVAGGSISVQQFIENINTILGNYWFFRPS